jgi:hypothetical protein
MIVHAIIHDIHLVDTAIGGKDSVQPQVIA